MNLFINHGFEATREVLIYFSLCCGLEDIGANRKVVMVDGHVQATRQLVQFG
jgi:hypothetical protein